MADAIGAGGCGPSGCEVDGDEEDSRPEVDIVLVPTLVNS